MELSNVKLASDIYMQCFDVFDSYHIPRQFVSNFIRIRNNSAFYRKYM